MLKIGDSVMWKGSFGSEPPKKAKITGITKVRKGEKDGEEVNKISWAKVENGNAVVDLDNGHWAYGSQISKIN